MHSHSKCNWNLIPEITEDKIVTAYVHSHFCAKFCCIFLNRKKIFMVIKFILTFEKLFPLIQSTHKFKLYFSINSFSLQQIGLAVSVHFSLNISSTLLLKPAITICLHTSATTREWTTWFQTSGLWRLQHYYQSLLFLFFTK